MQSSTSEEYLRLVLHIYSGYFSVFLHQWAFTEVGWKAREIGLFCFDVLGVLNKVS